MLLKDETKQIETITIKMKNLLLLFLTVITGNGNQSVSLQKTNAYLGGEGASYMQRVKEHFLQRCKANYLNASTDFYAIHEEDFRITDGTLLTKEELIENPSDKSPFHRFIIYLGMLLGLLVIDFVGLFMLHNQSKPHASRSPEHKEPEGEEHYLHLDAENEKRYITLEKEVAILKQIEDFEYNKYFLDKNISISVLAAKFSINHRYLSYVVNKHKKCDFATYVNELRVSYIVACLKNNPQYLKYKISYLADQCGFASHSRFTVTFKKITGYPPSTFISNLKNEKEE